MAELPTISSMLNDYNDYISERNRVASKVSYLRSVIVDDPSKEEDYNRGYAVLRTSEEKQLEYYEGYLEKLEKTITILDRVKEENDRHSREILSRIRARRRATTNRGMTNE